VPRPVETYDPQVATLSVGHYRELSGYQVERVHGSSSWLAILTVEGSGCFGYRGGRYASKAGDLCLLQPRVFHSYGILDGEAIWDLRWAHFQPRTHWEPLLDWPALGAGISRVHLEGEEFSRACERLDEAARLMWRQDATDELLAMVALEEILIRAHRQAIQPRVRRDPRIEHAVEFAAKHLAEPLGLNELAAAVSLSPSRFGHIFQSEMGISPCAFLERQRLGRALQMLEVSNVSVQEIATKVGFESPFYFSNRFRRAFGMSPSEYRKRRYER
jgi:AraC family transcriptional regulator of arabinose operon